MNEGIEKRIAALGRFFQGMQVVNDNSGNSLIYVTVTFPDNWIIADEITAKYGVTVLKGEGYNYYFACELVKGFEPIFDAIEYNVKKMEQAQERAELFRTKVNELQALFGDESIPLERLKTLEFSYNQIPPMEVTPPTVVESISESKTQMNLLERYGDYLEREKEKEEMKEYNEMTEPISGQQMTNDAPKEQESQPKSNKKKK